MISLVLGLISAVGVIATLFGLIASTNARYDVLSRAVKEKPNALRPEILQRIRGLEAQGSLDWWEVALIACAAAFIATLVIVGVTWLISRRRGAPNP